jgi:hypothetical protein
LVGLFHTHMLSFVVMSLVFVAASFRFRRAGRIVQQLVLFATTVAAGTVPWVLLSGFLHTASRAPKGWPLLDFPADLIRYIDNRLVLLLVVAVGLGLLTIFALKRRGRPRHMIGPYVRQRMGVLFLIFWSVGGFLAFVILTPAASFFEDRLSLMTAVPGLILFCAALVTVSQVIAPRHSWLLTMLLAMGIFTVTGRISLAGLETRTLESPFLDFIDRIKDWEFEPHTHIYADPNRHLILTYYSGLPVQSIAPVRKSFLNNTIDDVIIIETTSADSPLPIEHIVKEAKRASVDLSRSQAWQLMRDLDVALVSRRLQGRVAAQWPPVRELTPLERTLAQAQTALTRDQIVELKRSAPIFRGYDFQNWREWWAVFFYRFSGVEDRWRENLNFNDRIRDATAWVFPWGWVLYDCSRDGSSVLDSNMDRGVFD